MSLDEIVHRVTEFGVRHVTVTGGEPLAQKPCKVLLERLCDAGYHVALETSGALDVSQVDERVSKVMDLKTPGSGEEGRNLYSNVGHLHEQDQVKFVLCGQQDYAWAKQRMTEYRLAERCEVLFSPSHGVLDPTRLAEWILADRLPVRMQIQLHKLLWGDERGR